MSSNGRLTDAELAPIAQGRLARANGCAASWNALNVKARSLGLEIVPTGSLSSYRDYAGQVKLWDLYQKGQGALAARPGTSNHGWGMAVDVATPAMRSMIDRIGEPFGWAKKFSDAPQEWWHLAHRAGIWYGPDPGPYGAPPLAEENLTASAVAANGALHVWVASPERVFYAYQPPDSLGWSGQAGGYPAGLGHFAPAPEGHKITALAAARAANGVLHLFCRTEDGAAWACWQSPGQMGWSGGRQGVSIAGFSHFAPAR